MSLNQPKFKPCFVLVLLLCVHLVNFAQGIKGKIRDQKGQPLPNASLFIPELKLSSSSNVNGEYVIKLPEGSYSLIVRYIGYSSVEFKADVKDAWIEKDFVLQEQDVAIKEVAVGKTRNEDLAYSVIRTTVARKKYTQLLYNSYEMKAYIKGSGQLQKAPAIFRRKLQKEGLSMDEAYATESISHFTFKQPNVVTEKVISVKKRGDAPVNVGPSNFLNESFYDERVSGMVSPFAYDSFRFYRFRYEGSFVDGKNLIYKIRLTPKSAGDNVFSGMVYILDGFWTIHSVDLKCSMMGFPLSLKQNFSEVASGIFLPVTHQIHISMAMLGFKGEFKYLISCSNYKVEINKDLPANIELLDEKMDEIPEELITKHHSNRKPNDVLLQDKVSTTKKLGKLMDEYERQTFEEQQKSKVISNTSFSIDTLAAKRNVAYWDSIRPVPLTVSEIKGYQKMDSLAGVNVKKVKDSVIKSQRGFKFSDILNGHTYRLSKNSSFALSPALFKTYYNPVEGFNINVEGNYRRGKDTTGRYEISPTVRYGFAGKEFYSKGRISYFKRKDSRSRYMYVEGGRFIEQINGENSINEFVNTLSALISKRSFLKIYEHDFIEVGSTFKPNPGFGISASLKWEDRNPLENTSDYSFFYKARQYKANAPENIELSSTRFQPHQALTVSASINVSPGIRYRIHNGRKYAITDGAPRFSLGYKKGIDGFLGSDIHYDLLEVGANHSLRTGAGSRLDLSFQAGSFLNNSSTSLVDYKHFSGNRLSVNLISKPSFRLLDYFNYSTNNDYVSSNLQYHFRKFMLSRIPVLRLAGLKENVFFNYLKTSASPHYYEAGYSIDNIFRLVRLEVATSFTNSSYNSYGFRLGVTSLIRAGR